MPYRTIDFQALRPSQIKLGNTFDRVEIHCEYCKEGSTYFLTDSNSKRDASVSLNFIYTLKDNLEKSPIFKDAVFSLISSDSLMMELKDYKSRAKSNGLIIILDSIYLKDTIIKVKQLYVNYPQYAFGVVHKFRCKTYEKQTLNILDHYLLQDTVFWPSQPSMLLAELESPDVGEAMWDTGIKAGEKYAHYLAPYWTEQSRDFYFGGNKAFKMAYRFIQQNQLDSALNVLQKEATRKKDKPVVKKILYNMAIVYELKDDFISALTLADSSFRMKKKNSPIKKYPAILRLRKLDKIALDWQLND